MTTHACLTTDGAATSLSAEELDGLRQRLGGTLVLPEAPGYEDARAIWNAMIQKRPALIARCSGAADVIDLVHFARDRKLDFSVRGGGHNIAGTALCEGGLVIDLSPMNAVRAQPATARAWVQGGASWGKVDRETQAFGQAVPSGVVTTTGVAGLTLGGGFGWLTRRYGLTCDSLLAAEVVTADGRLLEVNADTDPDLLWALRGGGGNFGIVTGFTFQTHPVGPIVLGGMVVHDFTQARALLALFRDFTARAPAEVGSLLILRRAPPAPFLPAAIHGQLIAAIALCDVGPLDAAERALAPVRQWGRPLADTVAPKPFRQHQAMLDAVQPPGRHYYWKSEFLKAITDAAIDTMLAQSERLTSPYSSVLLMHLGGDGRRQGTVEPDPALWLRRADYVLNINASWLDPAESETHVTWSREFWRAMRPHANGTVYQNFLTADEFETRLAEAYEAGVLHRLAQVKRRLDPDNVFHHNTNIRPARA